MEAMTLEQVRDRIDKLAGQNKVYASVHVAELTEWMIALDAHLDKPAQAVDVGAVRRVIDELNGYCEASDDSCYGTLATSLVRGYTEQLARALSGEKAGPVGDVHAYMDDKGDVVSAEMIEWYRDNYGEDCSAVKRWTIPLTKVVPVWNGERWSTDAIYEARGRLELTGDEMWLPASPTPDKEGA